MNHEVAHINRIYEDVEKLSLFDLKQLYNTISNLLDDPERNLAVKRHLKIGMTVYYESSDRIMIEAIVLDVRKTIATVRNVIDNTRWDVHLFSIHLNGKDLIVPPKRQSSKLDRNSLRIGDRVGYRSKYQNDVFGVIKKLNPKKAVVVLGTDQIWHVPYGMLFLVMDGVSMNTNGCLLIEGEVINH